MPAGAGPDIPTDTFDQTSTDGEGVDLSDILAEANSQPQSMIEGSSAIKRGIEDVRKQAEIQKYGQPLKDVTMTAGQIQQFSQEAKTAEATNQEPPTTLPDEIDYDYLEQQYMQGKMTYDEYLAAVKNGG